MAEKELITLIQNSESNTLLVVLGISVVGGLATYLGKIWATMLAESDKDRYLKENNKLISELDALKQNNEHFHQVSQETYQKLFEKKIDVYQTLLKEVTTYNNKLFDMELTIEFLQDFTEEEYKNFVTEYNEFIKRIRLLLNDNKIFFSEGLLEKYKILEERIKSFWAKESEVEFNYLLNESKNKDAYPDDIMNEYYAKEDDISDIRTIMYNNTNKEFEDFTKKLNKDIRKIKKKISL